MGKLLNSIRVLLAWFIRSLNNQCVSIILEHDTDLQQQSRKQSNWKIFEKKTFMFSTSYVFTVMLGRCHVWEHTRRNFFERYFSWNSIFQNKTEQNIAPFFVQQNSGVGKPRLISGPRVLTCHFLGLYIRTQKLQVRVRVHNKSAGDLFTVGTLKTWPDLKGCWLPTIRDQVGSLRRSWQRKCNQWYTWPQKNYSN